MRGRLCEAFLALLAAHVAFSVELADVLIDRYERCVRGRRRRTL